MSKFKLPYNGESTPRKYQQHLSDNQLDLINDLYDMSLQINEQETDKPIVNNLKYRDQDKDRHQAVNFESLGQDFSKLKVNMNPPKAMTKFREKLPCFRERGNILKNIFENQVVVISGETGCGKTTQVGLCELELDQKLDGDLDTSINLNQYYLIHQMIGRAGYHCRELSLS